MAEVLLITGLVVGLFYFLFIRPTRREQSRRQQDLNALRIGDEVLTSGGLIGTVTAVDTPADGPMILSIELAEGMVVRAHTAAIAEILRSVDEIDELDRHDLEDDDGEWDDEDDLTDADDEISA